MRRAQSRNGSANVLSSTDHLNAKLLNLLQAILLADMRIAAKQRPELALPQHLPTAAVVVSDASCASDKNRLLDLLYLRRRYKEAQLVHRVTPGKQPKKLR